MASLLLRFAAGLGFSLALLVAGCASKPAAADGNPEWYSGERVQIHTRARIDRKALPPESDIFWQLPAEVKRIGANVSVRHIKGSCEGTWWPSSIGEMDPVAKTYDGDLAARLIEDAHAQGLKQIVYYRHFCDRWVMVNHPEWLALSREGKPVTKPGHDRPYPYVSLLSPFEDYAITHLTELAERGADGFYFDEIHTARDGDFSEYAQRAYRERYGKDLLDATDAEVLTFRQEIIAGFLTSAVDAIHSVNPDAVTFVSVNSLSLDALQIGDAPKYEDSFNNWLGGMESAATILSDLSGGNPHIWRGPTEFDSLYTVGRYLTFGAIYNRDIKENEFFKVPHELHPHVADLFELSRKVSPAMKDVYPYRFVRVAVNGELQVRKAPLDGQLVNRWRSLVAERIPAGYLSFKQMLDEGIPVDTRVVVIPEGNGWEAPMTVSEELQGVLDEFEAGGGYVVGAEAAGEGGWIRAVKDRGVPLTASGGSSDLGVVVYRNDDGSKYVVNISEYESSDIVLELSSEWFDMPSSVVESVSGQKIEVITTEAGWELRLPRVDTMAQVVILF